MLGGWSENPQTLPPPRSWRRETRWPCHWTRWSLLGTQTCCRTQNRQITADMSGILVDSLCLLRWLALIYFLILILQVLDLPVFSTEVVSSAWPVTCQLPRMIRSHFIYLFIFKWRQKWKVSAGYMFLKVPFSTNGSECCWLLTPFKGLSECSWFSPSAPLQTVR